MTEPGKRRMVGGRAGGGGGAGKETQRERERFESIANLLIVMRNS